MSTPPTPPSRSPERPGGPPLRRSNEGDGKKPHHFPWKVEPSPDGRGAPPPPKPPMLPRFARRIWPFLLILLALNYWVASTIPDKKARVEIPYTVFKNEVRAATSSSITSKGTAIQGLARKSITYPTGKGAHTSTNFQTEQPAFADTGLEALLEDKGVVVNAKPLDSGRSALASILLGFGPTILFVLLLVFLMRRAAGGGLGGSGGIGGFGRSRAKRYQADGQRVTLRRHRRHRRRRGGARGDRRLPQEPRPLPQARRAHPARRAARSARRARARPCSHAPSRARPASRSSRSPHRSSSR